MPASYENNRDVMYFVEGYGPAKRRVARKRAPLSVRGMEMSVKTHQPALSFPEGIPTDHYMVVTGMYECTLARTAT